MVDYFFENKNPFIIAIEDKEEYTYEEYIDIQKQLEAINLYDYIDSLYPPSGLRTTLNEFKRRITKGINAKIIDIEANTIPTKILHKIGNEDSQNCFVCCTPLHNDRHEYSKQILQSLEEVGFNGYLLLLNGGFPNPTGKEMKYAGVPYSFKIFMLLEAKKIGFNKVIWIDACCYATNDPTKLFDILEEDAFIFRPFRANLFAPDTAINIILPNTLELLSGLFNRDIKNDTNINSIVFGLNFSSKKVDNFISKYYEMVELGLPFFSSFPEENVFAAILNDGEYSSILYNNINYKNLLYINSIYLSNVQAKSRGYYFVQKAYN
jgi:hypothetical protein